MALQKWKRCPHCRKTYEFGVDQRGIGSSLIRCPSCNDYIIDKDNKEWELMDPVERVIHFFIMSYSTILYAIIPAGIILLADSLIGFMPELPGLWSLYVPYLIGLVIMILLSIWGINEQIRESNLRMKDPEYRELLKRAGLLK